MADIPGLIAGAADGAGLGHRFLGHVERCAALLHLIDATQDDAVAAYHTIRTELAAYDDGLAAKKELIALTKTDALVPEQVAALRAALTAETDSENAGPVMAISAVSGDGLQKLFDRLAGQIDAENDTAPQAGDSTDAADETEATDGQEAQQSADSPGGWHPLQEQ
jgi:GTP-binding protein